jgi:hypothetical protein
MAASLSDQAVLSGDAGFTNRVKEALATTCINIVGEAISLANLQLHLVRARFATQILNAMGSGTPNWPATFAITVAQDTTVIAGATQNGTVVLTSGNVAAQAALVTDAAILNAISAQFNSFLTLA